MENGGRYSVAILFGVVLMLTCGVGYGQNALKELWIQNGVMPCVEHGGVNHACAGVVLKLARYGRAYVIGDMIGGCACGFLIDSGGPRLTFIIGQVVVIISILWTMSVVSLSIPLFLFGATCSTILNSSLSIAQFFKSKMFIIALLSSSSDLSQAVYPAALLLNIAYEPTSYFLMACGAMGVVIGYYWLPDSMTEITDYTKPLKTDTGWPKRRPLGAELLSTEYILFVCIWTVMVVRHSVYLDVNITALSEMGDTTGFMANILSWSLPASFIVGLSSGAYLDNMRILQATFVFNLFGIAVDVLTASGIKQLQFLTIISFIVYKSSLFTMMYAFVEENFHRSNFGVLTGVPGVAAGISIYLSGSVEDFLYHRSGSHSMTFVILAALGVISAFVLHSLDRRLRLKRANAEM